MFLAGAIAKKIIGAGGWNKILSEKSENYNKQGATIPDSRVEFLPYTNRTIYYQTKLGQTKVLKIWIADRKNPLIIFVQYYLCEGYQAQ